MTSEQHRLFGRHSDIPECCIEAFVAGFKDERWVGSSQVIEGYAQYRVCNDCLLSNQPPVKLHICGEQCRETLLSFGFSNERIDGIVDEASVKVKARQQNKISHRQFRGLTFEYDYGPAPGVRPFEHLPECTILVENVVVNEDEYDGEYCASKRSFAISGGVFMSIGAALDEKNNVCGPDRTSWEHK